jgi:hypothetical protein
MRKVVLKYLVFAAFALTAATFTSCKSRGSSDVTLLESITWEYDWMPGSMAKFEYDDKNRIVNIISYDDGGYYGSSQTITYSKDGSVKLADDVPYWEVNFVRKRNTITVSCNINAETNDVLPETLTVNKEGFIVKSERAGSGGGGWHEIKTWQYREDNLIKLTTATRWVSDTDTHSVIEFTYDEKKSPFLNCNTPRWLLQFLYHAHGLGMGRNNIIDGYDFEYDSDGFPTRRTDYTSDEHGVYTNIVTFTYRGETETNGDEIIHDTDFSIYGTWEYVVSPSSHHEWKATPPKITINADNTVTALLSESHYRGVLKQIDSYEFRFHINYFRLGDFENDGDGVEWTLIYDPAINMLTYGGSPFKKQSDDGLTSDAEALELHHVVGFNDVEINIHIFYSAVSEGGYGLDSLVFRYGGVMQTVVAGMNVNDPNELSNLISVDDYNFDGYMDIAILVSGAANNTIHTIFLYNPQTKVYDYHEELSEMMGVTIDNEKQLLSSFSKGGHAGAIYYHGQFKWDNGQLTLIYSENQDWDDASQRYIRTTRTLQNSEWTQQTDTIRREDL